MNLREFCNETLSDFARARRRLGAALMGALGASLGGMVANLSAGKRGWDDKLEYFSKWAVKAQQVKDQLLALVDEDTAAFNKVMDAFALPKQSAEEKAARTTAMNRRPNTRGDSVESDGDLIKILRAAGGNGGEGESELDFRCGRRNLRHSRVHRWRSVKCSDQSRSAAG